VWAENWNGINGVPAEVTTQSALPVTAPVSYRADGTIYKKKYYGTGWQAGLVTSTKNLPQRHRRDV